VSASSHVYCTYFDHRYLTRGLAMIESLRRVGEGGLVWVLCLNDQAYESLQNMRVPGVEPIRLSDFERANPQVTTVREQRSTMEYFFTMTPWLVRHVMRLSPQADWVTYLDADLWFFDSPQSIYDELQSSSVGIIPHRYPSAQSWRLKYGTYNVGWVSFRLDDAGAACADWWAARCLEWCKDTADNGRFADQGYLDGFSTAVEGVRVIGHPGADVAPWNLRSHDTVWGARPSVMVDGKPLIFFHFHGLDRDANRYYFKHVTYGARTTRVVRDGIYTPYLSALAKVERELGPSLPVGEVVARRGFGGMPLGSGRRMALRGLSHLRGDFVEISSLPKECQ
jgi:hypothetical protein